MPATARSLRLSPLLAVVAALSLTGCSGEQAPSVTADPHTVQRQVETGAEAFLAASGADGTRVESTSRECPDGATGWTVIYDLTLRGPDGSGAATTLAMLRSALSAAGWQVQGGADPADPRLYATGPNVEALVQADLVTRGAQAAVRTACGTSPNEAPRPQSSPEAPAGPVEPAPDTGEGEQAETVIEDGHPVAGDGDENRPFGRD